MIDQVTSRAISFVVSYHEVLILIINLLDMSLMVNRLKIKSLNLEYLVERRYSLASTVNIQPRDPPITSLARHNQTFSRRK